MNKYTYKIIHTLPELTLQEEPYLMEKRSENGKELIGNERYEGYCKDLADLVADHMRIGYILKLVNDSKYGGQDKNAPSGWNGMVGELIRKVRVLRIFYQLNLE